MKPHKREQTPKPKVRASTPPPAPPLRTAEFNVADVIEMGDEFVVEEGGELVAEAADQTPAPVSATPVPAATPAVPAAAPMTTDDRAETEEVRYRRATLVSPISAQLAESMVSLKEQASPRDPAAPLMEGHDVTRRVVDADHQEVINESGPGYTVEVLDEAAAEARRRVELAVALEAAPDLAAKLGPLHRIPFLTRSPEEILARSLPEGASALIEHIDGHRTLEQIFGDSGLHPRDALRITAALLKERIIRIV
jgi:hypothetical protein